jgi:hypothetical protein
VHLHLGPNTRRGMEKENWFEDVNKNVEGKREYKTDKRKSYIFEALFHLGTTALHFSISQAAWIVAVY